MCTTVRDYISTLKQTVSVWKELKAEGISCHDYGPRCVKQDIAQVHMLSNKMISKVEQIASSRQIQKSLDQMKPLLRAEKTLFNLKKDVALLHNACEAVTLDSQKRSIQYTAEDMGLKFVRGDTNCYISLDADQFYIEIKFGDLSSGAPSVTQVDLVNEGTPQQSVVIAECLQKRDYKGFREHLEGFASVFNIPTETRCRPILYKALRALEEDLTQMANSSSSSINDGCVGQIVPPQGGIGMQLLYHKTSDRTSKACIGGECSAVVQLPITPLYIGTGCEGEHSFKRQALNNSEYVECSYVLRLEPPVTMTTTQMQHILTKLGQNTPLKCPVTVPLTDALLKTTAEREKRHKHPMSLTAFVKDDQHVYYLPEESPDAILVHRIPFTHPSQVPIILSALRQQQMFNTLLQSCNLPLTAKQNYKNNTESTTVDLTYTAASTIQCMFAHPFKPTLTTLTLTVAASTITCTSPDTQHSSIITNVMSQCHSIPLALRSLFRVLKHHNSNPTTQLLPTVSDSSGPEVVAQITDHAGSQVLLLGLNTAFNSPPLTNQSHMASPPMSGHMMLPLMKQPSSSVLRMTPSPPIALSPTLLDSPGNKKVMKRKRPMAETEGAKPKKISKVVKINEKPNIPKLEPMLGSPQLKHLSHPPIGPPSLKPAPVHPSSPPPSSLMIPNLSRAPHMTVRPGGVHTPPSHTGGVPSPQPALRIVPALSQVKKSPDKTS